VPTGDRHLKGAFDAGLAFDIGKINFMSVFLPEGIEVPAGFRYEGESAREMAIRFSETGHAIDDDAIDDAGFDGILPGHEDGAAASGASFERQRQHTANRPHGAIERQLTRNEVLLKDPRRRVILDRDQPQRDR
jgi:hypothetical protein